MKRSRSRLPLTGRTEMRFVLTISAATLSAEFWVTGQLRLFLGLL